MWNSAEIKNAFNCVEMEHSMPFYRLARFGFVAVPTPKDLGSILNANALYTFCSGVFQLAIGTLVLNLTGQWDLGFLMPLAVSSVSMMLTLANIFLDFSAILVQLEGEQRLVEKIQTQNEAERVAARKKAEQARDRGLRGLEEQFAGTSGAAVMERSQARERIQNEYIEEVREIESDSMRKIEIELTIFKTRVQRMKQIQRKRVPTDHKNKEKSHDSYSRAKSTLEDKKKQIQDKATQDVEELDLEALSAEQLKEEVARIQTQATLKQQVIDDALQGIYVQHAGRRPTSE